MSDEQRRRPGWIGGRKRTDTFERVLVRGARFPAAVALACVLGSAAAWAQPAPGSREAREEAREWYRSGRVLLESGDPQAALANFEAAYALYPHWATMIGMGLAWQAIGDVPAALGAFERALADGGNEMPADDRRDMQARVAALRTLIATALPPPPPPPVAPVPPPGDEDSGGGVSGWVWGLTAAAAALAVGGIATGSWALVLDGEYHDPATSTSRLDEIRPTGRALQVTTDVLAAAAGAAGLAALIVYLTTGDDDESGTAAPSPAPLAWPGGVGLAVTFEL